MKFPTIITKNTRKANKIKSLTSAAVILSLTACGADTLEDLQSVLTNGEELTVNVSANDEGNLVIGVVNDDGVMMDDGMMAAPANVETVSFSLNSQITVPPANVDGASGDATISVDTETGAVSGSVTVSGLTGMATAAHIHAGGPGVAGPIVVNMESNADGTVWTVAEGEALDAEAIALFAAGDLYINVHTAANPPGEVRGQLVDDSTSATGGLTVTLTNNSASQPMTPPVVILHNAPDADNGARIFEVGQPASDAIIAIAENGDNRPLINLLGYLTDQGRVSESAVGFADPDNPGPLLPGMTATVDLDLQSDDQRMTIVSMVVCTNDGFSAANAHTLSADVSETFSLPIFDAGSETNVLSLNYWVPPCSPDGSENLTDDENGSIMMHPGQSGSENPDFDFEAGSRLLEVTIRRN